MVDLSPIEIASTIRQTTSEYGKNFQKQLGGLRNDRNELRPWSVQEVVWVEEYDMVWYHGIVGNPYLI